MKMIAVWDMDAQDKGTGDSDDYDDGPGACDLERW